MVEVDFWSLITVGTLLSLYLLLGGLACSWRQLHGFSPGYLLAFFLIGFFMLYLLSYSGVTSKQATTKKKFLAWYHSYIYLLIFFNFKSID